MNNQIVLLRTSSCASDYSVNGVGIRIWIITGGIPAISFADCSFSNRFPKIEKWSDKHFNTHGINGCYYDHQDPNNIVGPNFDIFPNGINDVIAFIDKYLPLKNLRDTRFEGLPFRGELESKKVRDKEDCTRVQCTLSLVRGYIPCVTFHSAAYSGRTDEKIVLFSQWWKDTQILFNDLFNRNQTWESITEQEYEKICKHLINFKD